MKNFIRTISVLLFFSVALSFGAPAPQVVYPKKTELDFEGLQIKGQVNNPGDFYFLHKKEAKMDSLVKRRKNFHRELMRDAVLAR